MGRLNNPLRTQCKDSRNQRYTQTRDYLRPDCSLGFYRRKPLRRLVEKVSSSYFGVIVYAYNTKYIVTSGFKDKAYVLMIRNGLDII